MSQIPPSPEPSPAAPANLVKFYKTRSGPMMVLATDQYVSSSIALYGEYCPAEWRMLRQAIRPGMTVVEVGANMGTHSVDMARACYPGTFYAFEPQPRLFQLLCGNLAFNDIANALAYPEACGEEEGEAIVQPVDYARPGNFGGLSLREGGAGLRVRVRTIDSLGLESCGLIKIDVQGFETRVIRGARETIRRLRPVLYVENDQADQQQELIDLIDSLGYRMFWHVPPLFDPNNFRGETRNIFGGICSLNMLCLPAETNGTVEGATPIDPKNWTSPIRLAQ